MWELVWTGTRAAVGTQTGGLLVTDNGSCRAKVALLERQVDLRSVGRGRVNWR